jgi:hypothetical protein
MIPCLLFAVAMLACLTTLLREVAGDSLHGPLRVGARQLPNCLEGER